MRTLDPVKLSSKLNKRAEDDLADGRLGGGEVIVNQDGKRIFHGLFGRFSANGRPLQGGEIYRIASMTKPITGVALMREVERGAVDLFDPVSKYLPAYRDMTVGHMENGVPVADRPARNPILVYHLVSHTSGLLSGDFYNIPLETQPIDTMEHAVDYYATQPLSHDPYRIAEYSCAGFDVAARIVELVSGIKFGAYLKKNIFDPLGMKDTTFAPTAEQWARTIILHDRSNDGRSIDSSATPGCVYECVPVSAERAGSGLASTAEDYSLFAEMLLNGGAGTNGARVLSEESVRLMSTPWVPESILPQCWRWGLSMRVVTDETDGFGLVRGSFGWSGAFGSHFWVDPENRITAVYMRNSRYDGGTGMICYHFEEDVYDSFI